MLATVCSEARLVVGEVLQGIFSRSPGEGQQHIIADLGKDILLLPSNMPKLHLRLLGDELGVERLKASVLAHEVLGNRMTEFIGLVESWAPAPQRLYHRDTQVFCSFPNLKILVLIPVSAKLHGQTGVASGERATKEAALWFRELSEEKGNSGSFRRATQYARYMYEKKWEYHLQRTRTVHTQGALQAVLGTHPCPKITFQELVVFGEGLQDDLAGFGSEAEHFAVTEQRP